MLVRVLPIAIFAALASAQRKAVAFTSFPATPTVGAQYIVQWSSSGGPVTLSLRRDSAPSFATVEVLATTGDSYQWTPSTKYPSGDGYMLAIVSDVDGSADYSNQFTITGGSRGGGAPAATSPSAPPSPTSDPQLSTIQPISQSSPSPIGTSTEAATTGPPSVVTVTAIPSATAAADVGSSGLSTGAKAGIGVGVPLGVFAILGILAAFLWRQRVRARQRAALRNEPGIWHSVTEPGIEREESKL